MKETKYFLNNLIKKDDCIVIGVSGGPDSMCLLHILNSLKKDYNLNIICAHVNHGLRKESEKEAEFVKNFCKKNNIIFEYYIIQNYKNNKFSESEGRKKRYEFFDLLIEKYNANYLMTAHHGDDLIETILMRIVRGSNLKGFVGIPKIINKKDYQIIRPLLNLSKDDIINYIETENIEYVIDKSNEDEKYTRNRYRKHVLPFLKKEDKSVHLKFLKFSEELEKANCFIDSIVKDKMINVLEDNKIIISKLIKEEDFLQKKIIEKIIENIQKKDILDINDKQLNSIMNLIKESRNGQIDLSNNYIARRSYNNLYIEKINNIIANDYFVELNNNLKLFNKYCFSILKISGEKNNNIIRLNSEEIKLPLYVRNKKNGDKIKIKNLNGTKKLKDIFIDCKIDSKKRNTYPIVVDSNDTIIWIPGIKKSIFDKEINEKYDIILKYTEE